MPPGGPVDLFNSVADPTRVALVGLVWNSTLSNTTLLETRFGFNYISQTNEPNNKIDPKTLGINTGPLDAADLGVPGVNSPFEKARKQCRGGQGAAAGAETRAKTLNTIVRPFLPVAHLLRLPLFFPAPGLSRLPAPPRRGVPGGSQCQR